GGALAGARPGADRELDRKALRVAPLEIDPDPGFPARACIFAGEPGLRLARRDAPAPPGLEQRVEQRAAILETPIEPALGDAEPFGQHFDPHAFDAGAADLLERGLDPHVAPAILRHSHLKES